jgi:hypothetical protein
MRELDESMTVKQLAFMLKYRDTFCSSMAKPQSATIALHRLGRNRSANLKFGQNTEMNLFQCEMTSIRFGEFSRLPSSLSFFHFTQFGARDSNKPDDLTLHKSQSAVRVTMISLCVQ